MRPVVIAGPTASGKSAVALALAERDGGRVINADALQVYACWRILTARPAPSVLDRAPHRLYGHVDCGAPYSVGVWLREAAAEIDDALGCGERPIVVGGTGLYLSALTTGLADVPPVPPEVRDRSAALLAEGQIERMRADLQRDDPQTLAQIDRSNPMRVQRAWEVRVATGRGLAAWRSDPVSAILPAATATCMVVERDKTILNRHIADRFESMLKLGAIEEVAAFRAVGGAPTTGAGRALGASELASYLEGRSTLAEASAAAVTATRRYAKRQRTWFRNRMPDWMRFDPATGTLASIPGR